MPEDSKQLNKRYAAHLALCEIDLPGQQDIARARVLVIGAGGLGSAVLTYLAAAGIGHITVVDPDKVSLSNLQRQVIHHTADLDTPKALSAKQKMLAINPNIEVEAVMDFFTDENASELMADKDVVVDCTDNFLTRRLIEQTCEALGKSYVYGAVSRFCGQVFTHIPGSASYTDFFGPEPAADDIPCSINGVLNTLVGTVGTLQATEVLKLIIKTGEPLINRLLILDLLTMQFNQLEINN